MNEGKKFEQDFINSVPPHYWKYRLRDGTGNFAGVKNENVRFQAKNICDFIIYNGEKLYLLELKSHKGKSIPINCIRENQIKGLIEAAEHDKVFAGIVFNFRELEETYIVHIKHIQTFLEEAERKSIPITWVKEKGYPIGCEKKRTRYTYYIQDVI